MKVVYTAVLPIPREGQPVAARREMHDSFIPGPWMVVVPMEDVVLYVVEVVYELHKREVHVELSFLSEDEDVNEGLEAEEIAQFEMDLESLVSIGWVPLMVNELASSENESPVSTTRPH